MCSLTIRSAPLMIVMDIVLLPVARELLPAVGALLELIHLISFARSSAAAVAEGVEASSKNFLVAEVAVVLNVVNGGRTFVTTFNFRSKRQLAVSKKS